MSLRGLPPLLRAQPFYNQALDAVRAGARPWLVGPSGSEKAYILAALAGDLDLTAEGTVLIVTPSHEAADRLHDDLLSFHPELESRLAVYPPAGGPRPGRQGDLGDRPAFRGAWHFARQRHPFAGVQDQRSQNLFHFFPPQSPA